MADIQDLKIDSPPLRAPRRRRSRVVVAIALLALLVGGSWVVWKVVRPGTRQVEVYVISAENSGGDSSFSAGGYLEVIPPGPLVVSAMIEGRVVAINVVEGQSVEAGQEIARLDEEPYQRELTVLESAVALSRARLARMEAGFRIEEIAQAKAELERAQARLHQAQTDHERSERLFKIGAAPRKARDTSEAELAAAQAEVSVRQSEADLRERGYRKEDVAISRAELAAAESEVERIRWKLGTCVIKAPVSGVVLERFIQLGDWVSPLDRRERPGALVSMTDPRQIQAWIDVNQRDIARVRVGQVALLATDAEPGRSIQGRVLRLLPKANLQKNTVQVKVEIPDPPADLRPEMSVKVTFVTSDGTARGARGVTVPSAAVLRDGDKPRVFLLVNDTARMREVEIGNEAEGRTTLRSGVGPGDQVIVNPQGLSDGSAIERRK